MMRLRRLLRLTLIVVAVVVPIWVWALWPTSTAITRSNFAKIHVGMTLAETEAVLGGPARDESTGHLAAIPRADDNPRESRFGVFLLFGDQVPRREARAKKTWLSDTLVIRVEFAEDERVTHSAALDVYRTDRESPLGMLRRLLGL